jgi:Tol biopolymer transport system component
MKKLAIFAVLLGCVAAAFVLGTRYASREAVSAASPDGSHIAYATERPCGGGVCQVLWVGTDRGSAQRAATLDAGSTVHEIAWLPDGTRAAFLVDGYQLRFYNATSGGPAGQINLVEPRGRPTLRLARGVTFSENGRAVTFDDCPRGRSGCRSGLAAVPQ